MIGGVLSFIGIILMTGSALSTKYALLYSGLDQVTAAELIDRLETEKIAYQYTDKGGLYVDENKRDRIRMEFARDGLPKKGQAGYELLDDLSGFGTTSEMFEAGYWRAKEGEIARTITGMDDMLEARVHIAPQIKSAFSRKDNQPSASVTVRMRGGLKPDRKNAQAIKYLTALAVRGLTPERVSVVDATTGRLIDQDENDPEMRQIHKRLELEQKMSSDLEDLLGAHVGYDKVRVRVAAELSRDEQIVREKVIDPESRVLISSDTGEVTENSKDADENTVSAQQNTPDANADTGSGGSASSRNETNERANYEVSQTEREKRIGAGATERLSIAVMVDLVEVKGKNGKTTLRPRSAEELKTIEELVKSASGFDPKRGDAVTVKSLSFQKPPEPTPPPPTAVKIFADHFGTILQVLALLGSIAGVIFGIVRPIIRLGGDSKHQEELAALRNMYDEQIRALTPPDDEEVAMNSTQALINHVEEAIKEDSEEAILIIRQWLHETTNPPEGKSSSKKEKQSA